MNANTRAWLAHAQDLGLAHAQALAQMTQQISSQAALLGLTDAYWLTGWLFVGRSGLVWLARPQR